MTHGSLFSGIGGFDLASEWMGWTNVFHCEMNPFCNRVLKHHFPNAICYEDIKQTDFSVHRGRIDILTGGFPCQPYSAAGKRLGKEDDRHLWPEMLRAIREIQPTYIVGENVRGLLTWNDGVVLNEIHADLELEGYEVGTFVLPAVAVNAPHRRDRVWIVAYSDNNRHNANRRKESEKGRVQDKNWQEVGAGQFDRTSISSTTSDTNSRRLEGTEAQGRNGKYAKREGNFGVVADTSGDRLQRGKSAYFYQQPSNADAIDAKHIHTHKHSRPIPFERFPTKPPICGGDDGLPRELDGITFSKWRNESIKAYGNAIVPQVALQIFKAIQEEQ
jgi:DNA (cytosine-5)-methyltransferase 1